MREFSYRGCTQTGQVVESTIWADSQEEALARLRHDAVLVEAIWLQQKGAAEGWSWKSKDIIQFAYQMDLLLSSGIALRRIMDLLAQKHHPRIPYTALQEAVERGKTLATALEEQGYPAVAVALIKAGELS